VCLSVSWSSGVQSSSCEDVTPCQFFSSEEGTRLFGESFVEGIQREFLRDPGFGVALVAGVHSIGFTTILHGYAVNPKEFETHRQRFTSATTTLLLGYKGPWWDPFGSVISDHVISSVRVARVRGLE